MIKSLAYGQKPALIINEVQVGLLDKERAIFPALAEIAEERNIVAHIAELIAAFRAKGHPIFYTPATNRADMADKKINTMISAISANLRNMVVGSPDMGVETLVLTGVSTNVAITGLTMAGVEFGYHVVIPEDCIAGADREAHRVIVEHQLRMLATITTRDEVIAAIS